MKLKAFFSPRSIAVVGASREPQKVGHKIFKNLVNSEYQGNLYPINPKAEEIIGHKCYHTIIKVPYTIDLAIIVVRAKIVPLVVEQCGVKGVKGIIVISAGFSETGREGALLEKKVLDICRKYNMRMQGPNCLGIINTKLHMNASFANTNTLSGNIAFISQSGALGTTILNWLFARGVGLSFFVSLGNEADLNQNDFLEALAENANTKAIGIYIEGVKKGDRFIEVTKRLTKKKPIIALKAGTTDVGVRAISSHTGSLAGSDTAFSAAFYKSGIIRVNTLNELFDLVMAFEGQTIPRGKNVLIVTNGGGPGILTADACEKIGLNLPLLEYSLREDLRTCLPPHASVNNPIDILGDADQNRYKLAIKAGLKSQKIDGLIVILTPQAMTPDTKIAQILIDSRRFTDKPIISVFMGLDNDSESIRILQKNKIPNYIFPESAAYVLKRMYDYSSFSRSKTESSPCFKDIGFERIREIFTQVKKEERINLTSEESIKVVKALGVSIPTSKIATSKKHAGIIADLIGYPIAMKVVSPDIIHKTDFGGIILNVNSRKEAEKNYDAMIRNIHKILPQAEVLGILLQKMVPQGIEVIVGAIKDVHFGPLIMFGLGGIYVNFLRDTSYRLSPLTRSEAIEMIQDTKAYILLGGVRGKSPSDIDSIIEIILRISKIMNHFNEIVEMEINPIFVFEDQKGTVAIDARITLEKNNNPNAI
jgi:acetyltransferase